MSSTISLPVTVPIATLQQLAEQHIPHKEHKDNYHHVIFEKENKEKLEVGWDFERSNLSVEVAHAKIVLTTSVEWKLGVRYQPPEILGKEVLPAVEAATGDIGHKNKAVVKVVLGAPKADGWKLEIHPEVKVHVERITLAGIPIPIDIDHIITKWAQKNVAEHLGPALNQYLNLVPKIEPFWNQLQQPRQISVGWFAVQPTEIHLLPISIASSGLTITLNLICNPQVVFGSQPQVATLPLPTLKSSSDPKQFNIQLPVQYKYNDMHQFLKDHLDLGSGKNFSAQGVTITITDVNLSAHGSKAVAELTSKDGKFKLSGTPKYDPNTHQLTFPDLDFHAEGNDNANAINALLSSELAATIKEYLRQQLKFSLQKELQDVQAQLQKSINSKVGPFSLFGHVSDAELQSVEASEASNSFLVTLTASGQIQATLVDHL